MVYCPISEVLVTAPLWSRWYSGSGLQETRMRPFGLESEVGQGTKALRASLWHVGNVVWHITGEWCEHQSAVTGWEVRNIERVALSALSFASGPGFTIAEGRDA